MNGTNILSRDWDTLYKHEMIEYVEYSEFGDKRHRCTCIQKGKLINIYGDSSNRIIIQSENGGYLNYHIHIINIKLEDNGSKIITYQEAKANNTETVSTAKPIPNNNRKSLDLYSLYDDIYPPLGKQAAHVLNDQIQETSWLDYDEDDDGHYFDPEEANDDLNEYDAQVHPKRGGGTGYDGDRHDIYDTYDKEQEEGGYNQSKGGGRYDQYHQTPQERNSRGERAPRAPEGRRQRGGRGVIHIWEPKNISQRDDL